MFRSNRTPEKGLFLLLDEAKRQARAAGRQVIDLSVGASDLPAPPEALQTLQDAIQDPSTHSCEYHGHPGPQHALMRDPAARAVAGSRCLVDGRGPRQECMDAVIARMYRSPAQSMPVYHGTAHTGTPSRGGGAKAV